MSDSIVEAILLGVSQDAGVPQAGCMCKNCVTARVDANKRQLAVCLGLIDRQVGKSWIIDCTPDFPEQLHLLNEYAPECVFSGMFLSHAHIGHYTGLIHLGREAMNTQLVPIYVSTSMTEFLRCNLPWRQLVEEQNIELVKLRPDITSELSPNLSVVPTLVPHREEYTDTFAFIISGTRRKLFYCPDIDSWDDWGYDLRDFINNVEIALLDGTFFDADELPGRDMTEVKHPLIMDTASRLRDANCDVRFVHLNHTNVLLDLEMANRISKIYGVNIGNKGDRWSL